MRAVDSQPLIDFCAVRRAAMVRRWDRWRNPWDREYAMRGRLWRGVASIEPLPGLIAPPGPVLEVGCGDGKFLQALTKGGYDWVGADFSPRALALARAAGTGALAVADARALPFRDGKFPMVVARYLLGALTGTAVQRACDELLRVLDHGGFLMLEEFSTEDFRFGTGTLIEPRTFERNKGITSRYFERGELGALTRLEGVERERRHPIRIEGKQVPRVAWQFVGRKPAR
jgi:SAM-dependent methyltransferase